MSEGPERAERRRSAGGRPAGTSRRGGLASMEEAMEGFLRASGLGPRLSTARVMSAWGAALGEPLARRARAVRFQKGELLVEVLSAAHLQELANFTGEAYRVAANRRLGSERIRRVVFQLKR